MDKTEIKKLVLSVLENVDDVLVEDTEQGIQTNVHKVTALPSHDIYYFRTTDNVSKSFEGMKYIHDKLLGYGAKIPQIPYAQDNYDTSWMLTKEVPGQSLRKIKNTLSPDSVKEILRQTLQTLSSFWKFESNGFGYGNKNSSVVPQGKISAPYDSNFDFLTNNLEEKLNTLVANKHMPESAKPLLENLENLKSYLECNTSVFCHGDLSDKHIMVLGEQFTGLIDLDEHRSSSRFYDVAYLYSYLTPDEQDFVVDEMKKLLPDEENVKEKIIITNFFIAVEDSVYMIEELGINNPQHQHSVSLQKNLQTVLDLAKN